MVMQPPGFLSGLRGLTRQYDVLMIADEVAVGMGAPARCGLVNKNRSNPIFFAQAKDGWWLSTDGSHADQYAGVECLSGRYEESRSFFMATHTVATHWLLLLR